MPNITKLQDRYKGECIIQWNVQGLSTSKEEVVKLIDELKPQVLALQETWQGREQISRLMGYNSIAKEGHYNRRYHGGVTLYIHNSLPYDEVLVNTGLQIAAARVNIGHRKLITFVTLYMSRNVYVRRNEVAVMIRHLPMPFILMGDLNAHHELWGNDQNDSRGRWIEEMVLEKGLNILNDGSPTHVSGTAVDLTITSPEISYLWYAFGCVSSLELLRDRLSLELLVLFLPFLSFFGM